MTDVRAAETAALAKIEEALTEWFEAQHSDPDHPRHGKGDMIIDWVAGITVSNIIEVDDGAQIVGYANMHIAPLGNPNAHVGLAEWVVADISEILHPEDDS